VCGKKLSCTPDKVGRLAKCPHCGDTVRVAAPGLTPHLPDDERPVGGERDAEQAGSSRRAPRTYMPETTLDTAGSGLVWKALFFSVTPMALALGIFLGYAMRPPTPEEIVQEARAQAAEHRSRAEEQAAAIIRQAERQAAAMTPHTRRSTGRDAAAQMLRARDYIPRLVIENMRTTRSALGIPAVVGELKNTGGRAARMVELTLSYRTAGGTINRTKKHYPVDARDKAVGYTPPLQPGETTSFSINMDDRPDEATGEPDVQVTGVALAD
jgi:hypothetical protein